MTIDDFLALGAFLAWICGLVVVWNLFAGDISAYSKAGDDTAATFGIACATYIIFVLTMMSGIVIGPYMFGGF